MSPQTPAALDYRMPAEWEPHVATWLSWPRREGISFPDSFDRVMPTLRAMVEALIESEQVCINVCNAAHEAEAREALRGLRFGTNFVLHGAHKRAMVPRSRPDLSDAQRTATQSLRLWTGITTPGETNIRHSISMKLCQRASLKYSMFRCFIRA